MSDRIELDPDETRVRALLRRSDGPVTIRPFRPSPKKRRLVPAFAATAVVLVIALAIGSGLSARRQEVATPPTGGALSAASATPAATVTPETPVAPGTPVSAGVAPEAGVLYLIGSDDLTYRYDGASGELKAVSGRSNFVAEITNGVLAIGRDGEGQLLHWDGRIGGPLCPDGTVIALTPANGSCIYRGSDDVVMVYRPRDLMSPQPLAPEGWTVGSAAFDKDGSGIAFLRIEPDGTLEGRAHNSLWLPGKEPRLLYEPESPSAYLTTPSWSPAGGWIAVVEYPTVSESIAADGGTLVLIEVQTGKAEKPGTVLGGDYIAWSASGKLAWIDGAGRQTWAGKRLNVVTPGAGQRQIVALPDASYVHLAPAWSADGDLAFVIGPSSADAGGQGYMEGTGPGDRRGFILGPDESRREIRCPSGVAEGIRPSSEGSAYLLLCREPGQGDYPLSIWFLAVDADAAVPLVRGLGLSGQDGGGFGFYGKHPHLNVITAWSLAVR